LSFVYEYIGKTKIYVQIYYIDFVNYILAHVDSYCATKLKTYFVMKSWFFADNNHQDPKYRQQNIDMFSQYKNLHINIILFFYQ